jgi:hypothetical protein
MEVSPTQFEFAGGLLDLPQDTLLEIFRIISAKEAVHTLVCIQNFDPQTSTTLFCRALNILRHLTNKSLTIAIPLHYRAQFHSIRWL